MDVQTRMKEMMMRTIFMHKIAITRAHAHSSSISHPHASRSSSATGWKRRYKASVTNGITHHHGPEQAHDESDCKSKRMAT
jgi:hypothetical protein